MNYKRTFFLISCICICVFGFAQTQKGVVKPPGRMVNGKLVPGTLLQGATVQVDGSKTLVAKDGNFDFQL